MQRGFHAVCDTHIQQAFVYMPWGFRVTGFLCTCYRAFVYMPQGFCATGLTVHSGPIHDSKLLLVWTTDPRI